MLEKALTTCALAATITLLSGCLAGPDRLGRTWDDYVNQKYTEDAWIHGALLQNIFPIYPMVGGILTYVDVLFVNVYYFWSSDAWDGRGTGFVHENPQGASKTVDAAY